MPKQADETYNERETEARMQAALRGARLVGPKPKASITSKRAKIRKRPVKRAASAST